MGDYYKAEHFYAKTCELAPEEPTHWMAHLVLLYKLGRGLDALLVLDESEDHTYSPQLCYARVAVMMLVGREPEALRQLANTLQEEWDSRELLFAFDAALEDHDLIQQVIRCFA